MRAFSTILKGSFSPIRGRTLGNYPLHSRTVTNETEKRDLREKAQQKLAEMRAVVAEFNDHIDQCIARRQELQKKSMDYLKTLEENGKHIGDNVEDKYKETALAKIEEMRTVIGDFSKHNEQGITRRMMMREMAKNYLTALDDYRVRLQTYDPPNISDTRE